MFGIVLTACTNRKRRPPSPDLTADSLPIGAMAEVAAIWLSRVSAAEERIGANFLYCGRSFGEASRAARISNAPLFVVSAGLGLIDSASEIPFYSLTISSGARDNVLMRVRGTHVSSRDWWRHVSERSSSGTHIEDLSLRFPDGPILIGLPASYLLMIQDDLLDLTSNTKERLRIFSRRGKDVVDERLRRYVMPYDGRLDAEESLIRGTDGDFAQRATRHFAEVALSKDGAGTPEQHHAAVDKSLAHLSLPPRVHGKRATDDEIVAMIRKNWDEADGRATRMLRLARDKLRIACEQKRFKALFHKVRAERELAQ